MKLTFPPAFESDVNDLLQSAIRKPWKGRPDNSPERQTMLLMGWQAPGLPSEYRNHFRAKRGEQCERLLYVNMNCGLIFPGESQARI